MPESRRLRLPEEFTETPESIQRTRRLTVIRDQLRQANRRAAGPFSHPFSTRGSLSKLREQICDVSRIADAVLLNAESADEHRIHELSADLLSLLQTQRRWTERLENQIWRLESQAAFVKRLQQQLNERSSGSDRLWELCEVVARETQALPTGLLLLPEPGHRVLLSNGQLSSSASWSLEQARLAVFSAVTLLPEVRGADIVAQTLQSSAAAWLQLTERDEATSVFAESRWCQREAIANPTAEVSRLISLTGLVLSKADALSMNAVGMIAPPEIEKFYGALPLALDAEPMPVEDSVMARAVCQSLGLTTAEPQNFSVRPEANDDAAIVLTHKLRWHRGTTGDSSQPAPTARSRVRRPHFAVTHSPITSLTVFARED
ncbi:MAG: hypothetical protein KDB01_00490 [Planctomycetaceae bacterium]|nr:hypothetical protein [Planctomycetaceae bacterium]